MAPRKTSKKKNDTEKQVKAKAALANAVKAAETNNSTAAKTEASKASAKTSATAKKTEADKAPAKTATDAKAPAKTSTPAKASEQKTFAHIFEIDGAQINSEAIAERVREDYKADGHQLSRVRKMDIYYNFGERKAYYVINDKAEGKYVEF